MLINRDAKSVQSYAKKMNVKGSVEDIQKRGLMKLAKGNILEPDTEVFLAANLEGEGLELAFNKLQETYLDGKTDPKSRKSALLRILLGYMRATHWVHWSSHWQVQGSTSYSDHLLLEKLYKSLNKEIDTLAEKIVAEFGPQSVNPLEQTYFLLGLVSDVCKEQSDPIYRSLLVERSMQLILKSVHEKLKALNELGLGIDDFLAATANEHETNLYLLIQRTSGK